MNYIDYLYNDEVKKFKVVYYGRKNKRIIKK